LAGAASPAWFADGGEATVSAPVELPLYTEPDGRLFVVAGLGEGEAAREVPVRLGLAGPNALPADLVEALGLRRRGDAEGGAVVVPEVRLGDGVVVRDVRFRTGGSDVVLHLGTLEGLAVAVRPSRGAVSIVAPGEADA